METATTAEIEKIIAENLKIGTVYQINEKNRFQPNNNNSENSDELIQRKSATGSFSTNDYFILLAVHSLGYATVPTIMRRLALEKKCVPSLGISASDSRNVKKRLAQFVQLGLLYSFSYDVQNSEEITTIVVYVCSQIGWSMFRTRLMLNNVPFDKLATFRSSSDIMRRLAVNAVAYAFISSECCSGIVMNENVSYGEKEHPKKMNLLARVTLEKDNHKRRYIIEPVYFRFEPELITEERNSHNIEERLEKLQEYIEYREAEDQQDIKLILVVEDMDGLGILMNILKKREMNFFLRHAMITCERVVAKNCYRVDTSFLRILHGKDGYKLKLDTESILQ